MSIYNTMSDDALDQELSSRGLQSLAGFKPMPPVPNYAPDTQKAWDSYLINTQLWRREAISALDLDDLLKRELDNRNEMLNLYDTLKKETDDWNEF